MDKVDWYREYTAYMYNTLIFRPLRKSFFASSYSHQWGAVWTKRNSKWIGHDPSGLVALSPKIYYSIVISYVQYFVWTMRYSLLQFIAYCILLTKNYVTVRLIWDQLNWGSQMYTQLNSRVKMKITNRNWSGETDIVLVFE